MADESPHVTLKHRCCAPAALAHAVKSSKSNRPTPRRLDPGATHIWYTWANSGSVASSFPQAKPIARTPIWAIKGRAQPDAVPDASRADHSAFSRRCSASSVLPKAFGDSANAASLRLLYSSHSSEWNARIEGVCKFLFGSFIYGLDHR